MVGADSTARANVNVALVKYWGKRDPALNLPATGSISLTLDGLGVEAAVDFGAGEADRVVIDGVGAAGEEAKRVVRFLDLVCAAARRRERAKVVMRSTVPRGIGLASSAAAFAALALAASRAAGLTLDPSSLSALARRGSGSAARSIFGGFVEWHRGERAAGVDSFAAPLAPIDHWDLRTVECMHRVWALRVEGVAAFFTIDAGPQVKVLCAPADAARVAAALEAVPGVERILACGPGRGAEVVA